jgi:hypothetical protein
MDPNPILSNSELINLILAAGAAMVGAIGVLFKTVMGLNKKQNTMNRELGELKGKQDGIRGLSKEVLDTVHRAVSARDTRKEEK